MANLVVPTDGTLAAIGSLAYVWTLFPLVCKLYKSDTTPGADSVIGDFTEADFSGYAAASITAWTSPALDSDSRAYVQSTTNKTFTRGVGATSNDIYGYYVVDAGGNLLWAQRADSPPIAMTTLGQTIVVTPLFTLRSQYEHP